MVAGVVCPVRWPNVTSAKVQVPSAMWRDREDGSHRMRTARVSCSPPVSLGTQRPRSWVAACPACSLGWLASPSKRAYSRCPRPQGGAVPGGRPIGSLAVLVAASTRAASPGAPRSSAVRSAAPLAVACPSPAVVTCPRRGVIALEVCLS